MSKKLLFIHKDEVELKVCLSCDAPLPWLPVKISYFKNNDKICDDCYFLKKK